MILFKQGFTSYKAPHILECRIEHLPGSVVVAWQLTEINRLKKKSSLNQIWYHPPVFV